MPAVAAVTSHSAAAGLMLALAHDFVACAGTEGSSTSRRRTWGLPFALYFLAIMREKVRDFRVFKDMVMKARKIGAKEAAGSGVVDLVKGSAEETAAAAAAMAEEFVKRKWNGRVYASIRMGSMPGICRAVGLKEETDADKTSMATSKL